MRKRYDGSGSLFANIILRDTFILAIFPLCNSHLPCSHAPKRMKTFGMCGKCINDNEYVHRAKNYKEFSNKIRVI